jgi:hypothetical protein
VSHDKEGSVPKSQIKSADLDEVSGIITLGGPFKPGAHERPFNVEVVLIQDGAYAYGQSAAAGLKEPSWTVEAEIVGKFDPGRPALGFGTLISVDLTDAQGALHQMFTWSEAVELHVQKG